MLVDQGCPGSTPSGSFGSGGLGLSKDLLLKMGGHDPKASSEGFLHLPYTYDKIVGIKVFLKRDIKSINIYLNPTLTQKTKRDFKHDDNLVNASLAFRPTKSFYGPSKEPSIEDLKPKVTRNKYKIIIDQNGNISKKKQNRKRFSKFPCPRTQQRTSTPMSLPTPISASSGGAMNPDPYCGQGAFGPDPATGQANGKKAHRSLDALARRRIARTARRRLARSKYRQQRSSDDFPSKHNIEKLIISQLKRKQQHDFYTDLSTDPFLRWLRG